MGPGGHRRTVGATRLEIIVQADTFLDPRIIGLVVWEEL